MPGPVEQGLVTSCFCRYLVCVGDSRQFGPIFPVWGVAAALAHYA